MRISIATKGLAIAAGAILLTACSPEEDIRVYDAPKDAPASVAPAAPAAAAPTSIAPPAPAPAADAAPPAVAAGAGGVAWTVPAGWSAVPGERAMRVATFTAGAGDDALEVAVSAFPGDVGGTLANVNRWRQQIGLAPIDDAALADATTRFTSGLGEALMVRLANGDRHVVAAILPQHAGQTWFVKATGDARRVALHADAVQAFAASFAPGAAR